MEKTVWKYILSKYFENTFTLPIGYKVLDVRIVAGEPALYVIVPVVDNPETKTVKFLKYHTGESVPENCKYVGTCENYHVFEET